MSDQKWTELADKIDPVWAPEREWAVRAALARRASRKSSSGRTVAVLASAGVLAMGALAFALVRGRSTPPLALPRSPASATTPMSAAPQTRGEANITVTPLSSDTVLAPLPEQAGRGFALRAGGARFVVPHDGQRPFVVVARDVFVEDLGTTFTVQYVDPQRLRIAVEEGRVRVHGEGIDTQISAGASAEFPLPAHLEGSPKPLRPRSSVATSWRPLAERGQYQEAQSALRKAGPSAVRDDIADLLLAADAARLSGHPAEAVPYLTRVLQAHSHDPRAGLAAFTLGRVLLDELRRPREAVEAFAFARSAGGPLAEDALAREVEAVFRAGEASRSHELAELYLRLYPNGRRAKAVSRFGGLD